MAQDAKVISVPLSTVLEGFGVLSKIAEIPTKPTSAKNILALFKWIVLHQKRIETIRSGLLESIGTKISDTQVKIPPEKAKEFADKIGAALAEEVGLPYAARISVRDLEDIRISAIELSKISLFISDL